MDGFTYDETIPPLAVSQMHQMDILGDGSYHLTGEVMTKNQEAISCTVVIWYARKEWGEKNTYQRSQDPGLCTLFTPRVGSFTLNHSFPGLYDRDGVTVPHHLKYLVLRNNAVPKFGVIPMSTKRRNTHVKILI